MNRYRELHEQRKDAILTQDWAAKRGVDAKLVSMLEAAVQKSHDSARLGLYQQMLAGARASLKQETVDVEEYRHNLQEGSMTQLKLSFGIFTQGHGGNYPGELVDVLDPSMEGYVSCPVHKRAYVYRRPEGTVEAVRATCWKETDKKGTFEITAKAPVMVYCPECRGGLVLRSDLWVSRITPDEEKQLTQPTSVADPRTSVSKP